ncbi:MAG: hypothetical protein AAFN81_33895 [Bacteroidota bacterium]
MEYAEGLASDTLISKSAGEGKIHQEVKRIIRGKKLMWLMKFLKSGAPAFGDEI